MIDSGFSIFKRQSIRAAKDLLYGDEVVAKIKKAKTEEEITRIMNTARNRRNE